MDPNDTTTTTSTPASLSSNPTPNIPASQAILHLSSSRYVNAPYTKVWNALIDTSTWPSWNTFCPKVTIREQPDPGSSPMLQMGTKVTLHVKMRQNAERTTSVPLVVTEFEPPGPTGTNDKPGRIVTVHRSMPRPLLYAERVHEVAEVVINVGNGEMRRVTELRTWEAQVGYLAYVVRWKYGEFLQGRFENWVDDLKRFAEKNEGEDGSVE